MFARTLQQNRFCRIWTQYTTKLTFFADDDTSIFFQVAANVLFVGIGSFIKISIAQIFRMKGKKKSLVWYGAAVQAGSMTGALIMFPMVNVYYFFQNGQACVDNCPSLWSTMFYLLYIRRTFFSYLLLFLFSTPC